MYLESKPATTVLPMPAYVFLAADVYLGGSAAVSRYAQVLLVKMRVGSGVAAEWVDELMEKVNEKVVKQLGRFGQSVGMGQKGNLVISHGGMRDFEELRDGVSNAIGAVMQAQTEKQLIQVQNCMEYFQGGAVGKELHVAVEKQRILGIADDDDEGSAAVAP